MIVCLQVVLFVFLLVRTTLTHTHTLNMLFTSITSITSSWNKLCLIIVILLWLFVCVPLIYLLLRNPASHVIIRSHFSFEFDLYMANMSDDDNWELLYFARLQELTRSRGSRKGYILHQERGQKPGQPGKAWPGRAFRVFGQAYRENAAW